MTKLSRTGARRHALIAGALLLPASLLVAACHKQAAEAGPPAVSAPLAKVAPPAGRAWSDVVVKLADGGYRMGNPGAAIRMEEYGSLSCSHCAEFNKESDDGLRGMVDSGRVSFEFHNFVRDPIDITAAMLVRCAPPDSFFALTHEVYGYQETMFDKLKQAGDAAYQQTTALPPLQRFGAIARLAGFDSFFAQRGLAKAKADACLADTATSDMLAKSTEDAGEKLGIDSTPTFFFNGEKAPAGAWPDVKARLEAMGAR